MTAARLANSASVSSGISWHGGLLTSTFAELLEEEAALLIAELCADDALLPETAELSADEALLETADEPLLPETVDCTWLLLAPVDLETAELALLDWPEADVALLLAALPETLVA